MSQPQKSPQSELNIPQKDTHWLIEHLKKDLLISIHKSEPIDQFEIDLNAKIKSAYLSEFKVPIFDRDVTPTHIMGAPGEGKTTSFKIAAKWVADTLDLNLVLNPSDSYEVKDDDFIFFICELSGETSLSSIQGLPTIKEYMFQLSENDNEKGSAKFTTTAPPKAFHMLNDAKVSFLLFDDLQNASPSIQNVCLSLMEEKRYRSLKIGLDTGVGSTGNLGSLDGTNVSATSSAMTTRRQSFIGFDTPENWSERASRQFRDEIGDANLGQFFEQYPESFKEFSKSKKGEPFACSREWSKFVQYARNCMHNHNYLQSQSNNNVTEIFDMDEFITLAKSHVGFNAATDLKVFYTSLMNDVSPICRKIISGEKLNTKESTILSKHSSSVGHQSENFYSMFSRSLGELAAVAVSQFMENDPKNYIHEASEVIKNYTNGLLENGLLPSKSDKIGQSFTYFSNKLCSIRNDELARFSEATYQPNVNADLLKAIVQQLASNPKSHAKLGGVPIFKVCGIDVLTNLSRYQSTQSKVDNIDIGNIEHLAQEMGDIAEKGEAIKKPKKQNEELSSPSMF
ncbi:MAG: hypothetical protein HAW67_06945 [Endozoicomonadaceae bacterium]|nr:hypothetical protein [Endozoicomonadaceae bacterium]